MISNGLLNQLLDIIVTLSCTVIFLLFLLLLASCVVVVVRPRSLVFGLR